MLSLHDIMLLIQTLECLYSLSSLGERACNAIVHVHGVIDTLVSLITVEVMYNLTYFYKNIYLYIILCTHRHKLMVPKHAY